MATTITGEYKDNFVVVEGSLVASQYIIPKDKVENYDGREISLRMRYDEINEDFKI